MMSFVASVEVLSREFKSSYPNGKVLILINGDYSSKSIWTEGDKGQLGYEVLSQLAQKYEVVFVFGNHEAFDWKDTNLFINQMSLLKEAGVHLLAANANFVHKFKNLFAKFVDIPLGEKSVRFAGFTLSNFPQKSGWNKYLKPKVFTSFYPIEERLYSVIKETHKNSLISSLVLAFHEGSSAVSNHFKKLDRKLRCCSEDMTHKISAIFLGHHHAVKNIEFRNSRMISSGDFFNFTSVLLDDEGQIIDSTFYDQEKRRYLLSKIDETSLESKIITDKIKPVVHAIEYKRFQSNKFIPRHLMDNRKAFLNRRTILGTLLAETLRLWAYREIPMEKIYQTKTYIAVFLDSNLYQRNDFIREKTLIDSNLISTFYPKNQNVHTLYVTGEELESLYFSLANLLKRHKKIYSPQISSNLKVKDNELLYLINKNWKPVRQVKSLFLLVLDQTLAQNLYHVPKWTSILSNKKQTEGRNILKILNSYFLRTIGNKKLVKRARTLKNLETQSLSQKSKNRKTNYGAPNRVLCRQVF